MPTSKLLQAKNIQAAVILDCVQAKNKGKKTKITPEQWLKRRESTAFAIIGEMRDQIAARKFDNAAILALRGKYSKKLTGTNYAACFEQLSRWPDGADQVRMIPAPAASAEPPPQPPPIEKPPAHNHWVEVIDEATGESHYYKPGSGQVSPMMPADAGNEEGGKPADWIACYDTLFKVDYYYNRVTKVATWSRPAVIAKVQQALSKERDPVKDKEAEAKLRERIAANPLYAPHTTNSYVSLAGPDKPSFFGKFDQRAAMGSALEGKPTYEALRDEEGEIEQSKVGDVFVIENGVIRETLWTSRSVEVGGVVRTEKVKTKTVTLQNSKTIDSITATARLMLPYFHELIETIVKNHGGTPIIPGLKGLHRAAEKIATDYKGDASRMVDVLRACIMYDTIRDALNGYRAIVHMAEDGEFKELKALAEVKQRFKETREERENDVGYKDINLQLVLANSMVAELQITVRALAEIKEFDRIQGRPEWVESQAHHGTHKAYEVARQMETLTPAARDQYMPKGATESLEDVSGSKMVELAFELQNRMVKWAIPKAEDGQFLTEADADTWRKDPVYAVLDKWLERLEEKKAAK